MSEVGSPGGPGAPSNPPTDGAELARRMIVATEAAASAAQSAAQALADLGSRGKDEKSWYKVLPKPGSFDPKSREEELAQWRDFCWGLEQYLASLDTEYTEDIKSHRQNPHVKLSLQPLGELVEG